MGMLEAQAQQRLLLPLRAALLMRDLAHGCSSRRLLLLLALPLLALPASADVYIIVRGCNGGSALADRQFAWKKSSSNPRLPFPPLAKSGSYHVEPLPDLDADFGPQLTDLGIVGVLKVSWA